MLAKRLVKRVVHRQVADPHRRFRLTRAVTMLLAALAVAALAKVWLLLTDRRPDVTVDTFLPFSRLKEFLQWWAADCGHFPLWCVPYRRVHDYEWLADSFWQGLDDELMVDIAIYGMRQRGQTNYYRLLEKKLQQLNGVKTLISYNYYPEDEFWRIFNRPNFEAVKAITDPDNIFRTLYQKTCRAAMGQD